VANGTTPFNLERRVAVYGGFAGTETHRNQRNSDPITNGTILSGQGTGQQIVTAFGSTDACLDGFSLVNANNSQQGAAMVTAAIRLQLANLVFMSNQSSTDGGALCVSGGQNNAFEHLIFGDNHAVNRGGAVFLNGSSSTFIDCQFIANEVHVPANTVVGGG